MKLMIAACIILLGGTVWSLKVENCGAPEEDFIGLNVTNCEDMKSDNCSLRNESKLSIELAFIPHQIVYAGYVQVSAMTESKGIYPFFPLYLDDLFKNSGLEEINPNIPYKIKLNIGLSKLRPKFFETTVRVIIIIQGDNDIEKIICSEFNIIKK